MCLRSCFCVIWLVWIGMYILVYIVYRDVSIYVFGLKGKNLNLYICVINWLRWYFVDSYLFYWLI